MKALPENATIKEAYGPAMEITDQKEADEYFEMLVQDCIRHEGVSRQRAIYLQHSNLDSYSVHFDSETRKRMERLFKLDQMSPITIFKHKEGTT